MQKKLWRDLKKLDDESLGVSSPRRPVTEDLDDTIRPGNNFWKMRSSFARMLLHKMKIAEQHTDIAEQFFF